MNLFQKFIYKYNIIYYNNNNNNNNNNNKYLFNYPTNFKLNRGLVFIKYKLKVLYFLC